MWQIVYTTQAQKDAKKLAHFGFKEKAQALLVILYKNPFQNHEIDAYTLLIPYSYLHRK